MKTPLVSFAPAPTISESRGRLHVCIEDRLYRLRFWSEEEWAALDEDSRPAIASFSPWLGCWVEAEPAPHLNN